MADIETFAVVLLAGGLVFLAAVLANKITARVPIPAPALFLAAATIAAALLPRVGEALPTRDVERIVSVALIFILFDGGMHIGWRRFREAATPILTLGVFGTFFTAALAMLFAHYGLGLSWDASAIVATAVAPTNPAVVFSILGKREVVGRSATILEGESGANDPVGISLMVGVLAFVTGGHGSVSSVAVTFVEEMAIGTAVGVLGGMALIWFMRRIPLPSEGLYPLRTAAAAVALYSISTLLDGSGFLAALVAGVVVGDARAPYKPEIERFHASVAALAEIVVFITLGLTIRLGDLVDPHALIPGLVLAAALAFVIRPLAVGPLLLPVRLQWGERIFMCLAGLKGAVPILVGAFVLLSGVAEAANIYAIIVLVVGFSVFIQGPTIPAMSARLGVPMRLTEPQPWDVSVRLQREPEGVARYFVEPGSPADGRTIAELDLAPSTWISFVVRDGRVNSAHGHFALREGDELLVLHADGDAALPDLFAPATPSGTAGANGPEQASRTSRLTPIRRRLLSQR